MPAHNLRTMSTSLTTLSKIGKYLYVEFDPLSGLIFRTLNDAKSSYAQFTFDVGFFERCTTPPGALSHLRRRVRGSGNAIASTRTSGTVATRRGRRRRKRHRSQQSSRMRSRVEETDGGDGGDGGDEADNNNNNNHGNDGADDNGDNDDDDDDDILDEKYFCRVNIKTVASILTKSRRGVQSLRIRSLGLNNHRSIAMKMLRMIIVVTTTTTVMMITTIMTTTSTKE